jgi:hypothetical protein
VQIALIHFVNFTVGEIKLMLTATPWKKLSQVTAAATLSVAVLAAMTTPASAVNIKEFQLAGIFALQAEAGATGVIADLAGGSFDGTYKVDLDKLPVSNALVNVQSWNINFRNASNAIVDTLSDQAPSSFALVVTDVNNNKDNLEFYKLQFPSLLFTLPFDPGFTGIGNGQSGSLIGEQGTIFVASTNAAPVPEPLTLGGTLVVGAIGLWMKSKSQKSSLFI